MRNAHLPCVLMHAFLISLRLLLDHHCLLCCLYLGQTCPGTWNCMPHRPNPTALQAEKLQGVLEARGPAFLETYKLPLLSWEEAEELKQSTGPALESRGNGAASLGPGLLFVLCQPYLDACVLPSSFRHQLFHRILTAALARPSFRRNCVLFIDIWPSFTRVHTATYVGPISGSGP